MDISNGKVCRFYQKKISHQTNISLKKGDLVLFEQTLGKALVGKTAVS